MKGCKYKESVLSVLKKDTSKIKIFVGYYKPNMLFSSEVYQPILTSDTDWNEELIVRDNTGDNIADRNCHYAELSGHYWIWKNYLPTCDAEYIGYCHYRRFLDFNFSQIEDMPFRPTDISEFEDMFKQYSQKNILKAIDGYDIVLPQKFVFASRIYDQYVHFHPKEDMDMAINIIAEIYPEYKNDAFKVLSGSEMYTCMNFVMKKELFAQYQEWIFNIMLRLEERTNWDKYTNYLEIRTPAFIAERFFNIWLEHNIAQMNLKVFNTTSVLLVGGEYNNTEAKMYIPIYLEHAKKLKNVKNNAEDYILKI